MYIADSISSSLTTIFNHKFRSFLTLLGIVIGVTSVVTMYSSVTAVKTMIHREMSGMGYDNTLLIQPRDPNASSTTSSFGFGMITIRRGSSRLKPITFSDYEAIREFVPAKHIYGYLSGWGQTPNKKWVDVRGVSLDYFHQKNYIIQQGQFFSAYDMKNAQKVCVVGDRFAENHLDGEPPLGKVISVGRNRYKILGVITKANANEGSAINMNWESYWDMQQIFIPLKTGAVYLRRNLGIDYISMQAESLEGVALMRSTANQVMLARHKMAHDFAFQDISGSMLEVTQQIDEFMKIWNTALLTIASISLAVGGIGLFSTLLISINERMMEIGVRKSIGARDIDIFTYFLIEALTLSLIAGILGTMLGILLTQALGMLIKMSVPIDIISINIGNLFAIIVGLLSGLYPAIKASKINPIQAIYYFE